MSDALEALIEEEKIETVVDMLKDNAITMEYIKSSGKYSPSEIEKIKAALEQN